MSFMGIFKDRETDFDYAFFSPLRAASSRFVRVSHDGTTPRLRSSISLCVCSVLRIIKIATVKASDDVLKH